MEVCFDLVGWPANLPKHSRGTRRPKYLIRGSVQGSGASHGHPGPADLVPLGSVRRDCTDHLVGFNAEHLRRILAKYAAHYNEVRTHVSLRKDAPCARPIERFGDVVAHPILGGLRVMARDETKAATNQEVQTSLRNVREMRRSRSTKSMPCACSPADARSVARHETDALH